jgi:two-component system chemotaxis response regulator CheY
MRALVIDDSRAVRLVIGHILREIGLEVLEAKDGQEALARLKSHPDIDLMLVDWNMPQMNGIDLIRTVRADRAYSGMRILMVTSEARAEQVTEALSAGANEYLMKPFNKDVLVAKLNLLDVLPE